MPKITPESEWLRDAAPGDHREFDCTGQHRLYKSQPGKTCFLRHRFATYAQNHNIQMALAHSDNHTLVAFKACPDYAAFLDVVGKSHEGGRRL